MHSILLKAWVNLFLLFCCLDSLPDFYLKLLLLLCIHRHPNHSLALSGRARASAAAMVAALAVGIDISRSHSAGFVNGGKAMTGDFILAYKTCTDYTGGGRWHAIGGGGGAGWGLLSHRGLLSPPPPPPSPWVVVLPLPVFIFVQLLKVCIALWFHILDLAVYCDGSTAPRREYEAFDASLKTSLQWRWWRNSRWADEV